MRSIDLPDELLKRLEQRYGPSGVVQRIAALIERDLRDSSIDLLSSTKSKECLHQELYAAVDAAARSGKNYAEFIVLGQSEVLRTLEDLGVAVRQCIVDVDITPELARRQRATSWILLHLHHGCVQSKLHGNRLLYGNDS